jgi:hypothetical protein
MGVAVALGREGRADEPVVRLRIFWSAHCASCRLVDEAALDRFAEKLGCRIEAQYHDINKPENFQLCLEYEKLYGDTANEFPVVFVGGRVVAGKTEIQADLRGALADAAASGQAEEYPALPTAADEAATGDDRGGETQPVEQKAPERDGAPFRLGGRLLWVGVLAVVLVGGLLIVLRR